MQIILHEFVKSVNLFYLIASYYITINNILSITSWKKLKTQLKILKTKKFNLSYNYVVNAKCLILVCELSLYSQ